MMLDIATLREAVREALTFLEASDDAFRVHDNASYGGFVMYPDHVEAIYAASMDLTRKLAELRGGK